MTDSVITCPNCKTSIKLTESLAAPYIERLRQKYEEEARAKEASLASREAAAREQAAKVASERAVLEKSRADLAEQVNAQVVAKVAAEKRGIEEAALKKAREESSQDVQRQSKDNADLREQVRLQNEKLALAQAAQAAALKRERELDEQKRELELTIQRKVGESLAEVEAKARQRSDEENRLRLAEKDKMLADAQRRTEELQRRLEQGSQQLQGEVQELGLEAALRSSFPGDTIEEVGKGEHGGDAVHTVSLSDGRAAGVILWESKRTERWSPAWLPKLRDDARSAGADIPVIVSRALPKDVETFGIVDGVWVCGWKYAVPLAICLRQGLIAAAQAKQVQEGQQTKMGLVYEYLTGQGFRARLEAIVEAFGAMQDDLEKEKKAIMSQWAKRSKQLELAVGAATGMYGDLQGIVGRSLHQIEGLEVKALNEGQ